MNQTKLIQSYKILIVDDEESIATVLAARLVKNNFQAQCLSDPLKILLSIEEFSPHLVMLDFRMPQLSGLECLNLIRQHYADLPVIFLTSEESSETVVQCFEAGAQDYILKGAPLAVVKSRILAQIGAKELMEEKIRVKELHAIMALVVSYNHEINNPLAIALGYLDLAKTSLNEKQYQKIYESLTRIQEVIAKLKHLADEYQIEFDTYAGFDKLIKL